MSAELLPKKRRLTIGTANNEANAHSDAVEGDIEYRVRGESTGIFDCIAEGGKVDHHVSYGKFIIAPNRRTGRLLAALNDGGNSVVLHTEDGNIKVAVVSNPTDIGTAIFP